MTVQHLKNFGDAKWYECWYIGSKPGQRQVAPVGSFLVSDSRSQTFTMTSAVDPHDFKTMVITLQLPSADGAFQQSKVILRVKRCRTFTRPVLAGGQKTSQPSEPIRSLVP